jgi:hypothetical protein
MERNLWFSQSGESYNGMSCDDIYGGCPVTQGGKSIIDNNPPVPVSSDMPVELGRGDVNGDGYDPGYLQVLEDGTTVDANGRVISTGTSLGIVPIQPILQAGDRVQKQVIIQVQCIQAPCHPLSLIKSGTVTGVIQETLPPKYEIIWDLDGSSFELASDLSTNTRQEPIQTEELQDSVVPNNNLVMPQRFVERCGEEQYAIPFKIQGEEKCIDKTLALVLGAIAIYYIMTKK